MNIESPHSSGLPISAFDELLEVHRKTFRAIGTAGYTFVMNFSRFGPEHLESTYPTEWQRQYDAGGLHLTDPAFLTGVAKAGRWRWSELKLPDVAGVMKKAKTFGLNYGAIISHYQNGARSLIGVARPDRELTDDEIAQIKIAFLAALDVVAKSKTVTDNELDVIRCLAMDMSISETSAKLGIKESAAKMRVNAAKNRLQCQTTTGLIATVIKHKLI